MIEETKEGIIIERTSGSEKVNIILDMSKWDLFEVCKARYNMRYNMNKAIPITQKSSALDSGGLAHEGLEQYFLGIKKNIHYNDRMQNCLARMRLISSDPDQCNLSEEDAKRVISAVEESCDFWRFEDEQMEILEVERAFAYVLYEDDYVRIIISGKIDLLVNIRGIGRAASYSNLPIDHKTYSRDFEVPRLSNQFQNYAVATNSNYLVVNRIGLHDPQAKNPKSPEEKFKRVPLSYDPFILEEWKQNIISGILHEYLDCVSRQDWRMNFTSCYSWNRKCEYYEICETSGADNKAYKLESQFATVSPWDVTARLKKS